LSQCVKVDTLGRLCDNNLGRLYNHFTTTNIYLIGAAYNSYFLIIYKPSSLIISPWTFSTQLEAGTAWFCLSQYAIPFCTLLEFPSSTLSTTSLLSFSVLLFTSSMYSHFSDFQFPSTAVARRLCNGSTLSILLYLAISDDGPDLIVTLL